MNNDDVIRKGDVCVILQSKLFPERVGTECTAISDFTQCNGTGFGWNVDLPGLPPPEGHLWFAYIGHIRKKRIPPDPVKVETLDEVEA